MNFIKTIFSYFLTLITKFFRYNRERETIPFLVFWVGTKCTLRCQKCCNLIPYLSEPKNFDEKLIIRDLKKISRAFKIRKLQIQGGEPLTHKKIDIIIRHIGTLKIENISITTNGTLTFSEAAINALRDTPKTVVNVSNYSFVSDQRQKLIQQLKDNNINYSVYDFMYNNALWFDSGGPYELKIGPLESQHIFDLCENKICWTLADGLLTICGKITALKYFHNDYKTNQNDEVNVRGIRNIKKLNKEVNKFIANKNYREQCRYCLGTSKLKRISPGIQLP
jgi:MoaA/NifB/PqqE/SkfB family radical SAM enzyme